MPRGARDLLRFGAGALPPMTLCALALGSLRLGIAGLVAMGLAWLTYRRLRATDRVSMCQGCNELQETGVCSGYAGQAAHVRRYEDAATEFVMSTGSVDTASWLTHK